MDASRQATKMLGTEGKRPFALLVAGAILQAEQIAVEVGTAMV